ncbi:MAG TPA: hypothetical protein VGQ03_00890 [Nitrososphaera sp.]|nr:hypothetical protein [Nitrososphaera sp.]
MKTVTISNEINTKILMLGRLSKTDEQMLQIAISIMLQAFGISYAWLDQNLISPVLTFARGFEFAIVLTAAVLFFLISMFLVIRQAKKLPKSYSIEIVDIYGEKVSIDGVRQIYTTHAAAESYARMYRESFGQQYKFKVVGFLKELHR